MTRSVGRLGGRSRIWIVRIVEQHRIRLPLEEIRVAVSWLNSEGSSTDCVAIPGPAGGIQIQPFATHELLVDQFAGAVGNASVKASDSDQNWVNMARLLATSWRISLSVETNRISLTLPEPIRRARQLPEVNGEVVVFAFGEILEIWDAAKWWDHVRAVGKTKLSAFSQAIEDLRDR